jgi:hypothetical protein
VATSLQEWERLLEKQIVPMSHLTLVSTMFVKLLKDKSVLVRRAAMKGLEVMLVHNPFGARLDVHWFQELLAQHEAALEQREALPDGAVLTKDLELEGVGGTPRSRRLFPL